MKRLLLVLVCLLVCSFAMAEEKGYTDIKIKVIKEETGKPVRNASVILLSVDDKGKQGKNGANLKTDPDGFTAYNGLPYGKVRVQVIARGLQTFGDDYVLDSPTKEIVIKMKPPQQQYSIYDDKHPAPNAKEK